MREWDSVSLCSNASGTEATCVGPEETESELKAINLLFLCYKIWSGAEYISTPHAQISPQVSMWRAAFDSSVSEMTSVVCVPHAVLIIPSLWE